MENIDLFKFGKNELGFYYTSIFKDIEDADINAMMNFLELFVIYANNGDDKGLEYLYNNLNSESLDYLHRKMLIKED